MESLWSLFDAASAKAASEWARRLGKEAPVGNGGLFTTRPEFENGAALVVQIRIPALVSAMGGYPTTLSMCFSSIETAMKLKCPAFQSMVAVCIDKIVPKTLLAKACKGTCESTIIPLWSDLLLAELRSAVSSLASSLPSEAEPARGAKMSL